MSLYHKGKKQGQNFIKLALSITRKFFVCKNHWKSLTPQSLTVWYHCYETTYTTQIFLYGIQIHESHIRKYQCCGAEIIYFRLRLRLQLHLCPLFQLQLQLQLQPYMHCHLKLFYNSSTIPTEVLVEIS